MFAAAGDLDGDGRPDLVVVNHLSRTVTVLLRTAPTAGVPGTSPGVELVSAAIPNPTRDRAAFRVELAAAARVDADVFDLAGRRVRAFGGARLEAGVHTLVWDGRAANGARVPPGLYFARVGVERRTVWRRVVVTR